MLVQLPNAQATTGRGSADTLVWTASLASRATDNLTLEGQGPSTNGRNKARIPAPLWFPSASQYAAGR